MKSDIETITDEILQFRNERDWKKFHDPKNLVICLNVEASELLEQYLWKEAGEVDIEKVKDELADVFYSAFLIAHNYDLNVKEIVLAKLETNKIKYPTSKAKGSNKKYDQI